jgi:Domain of unknown function (DUF4383)
MSAASRPSTHPRGATTGKSSVQRATTVMAVVFLLVGVLGFIPGFTVQYGQMMMAGHHSGALLLGVFNVSVLHNIVHLAFGVAGLIAARTAPAARLYLLLGGAIYLVLWIYGLVVDPRSQANFVPLNTADNWLHLGLGVAMLALGLLLGGRGTTTTTSHASPRG